MAVAALAVLIAAADAAVLSNCATNTYTYLGNAKANTWQCNNGAPSQGTTVYGMAAPEPVMFFFGRGTSLTGWYSIQLACDAQAPVTFSTTATTTPTVVGPCKSLNVSFVVSQYTGYGFQYELSWTTSFVTPLKPGVPNTVTVPPNAHGSLISYYFNEQFGAKFTVNATVYNYDGFVAPQLIEASNYMPLPGQQDKQALFTEIGNSGTYTASLSVSSIVSGFYGFGIELFGGVDNAIVDLVPHWTYSFPTLPSGYKEIGSGASFFQAEVGTSSSITVQLARTNQGGYPFIDVYAGSPYSGPVVANLTTANSENYDSVTIGNPWVGQTEMPNPGLLILSVSCDGSNSCGFSTAVSW